jgi:hypothetical protein
MQGAGAGIANPDMSPEKRGNNMLDKLTGHLAVNPFDNATDAASLDLRKVLAQRKGVAGLIDPNTFSKLGSTNENILGVNTTPADIVAQLQDQYQDEGGGGLLRKILGGMIMGGSAIAAPFTGGTSLAGMGLGKKVYGG